MSQQVVRKLSAIKQKLSLGEVTKVEKANAASASTRKIIRTTVVNPDEIEWPFITDEDEQNLIAKLVSVFQVLNKPDNMKVPLNIISEIEKNDRRNYRRKWQHQHALEIGFDEANHRKLRCDLSIGVNSVSTGLEKETVTAVIIDKDVDPTFLTKLLVPIAKSKNIPIVAIKGLSTTCKKAFKTRCISIGFKAPCMESSHPFYLIYRLIVDIVEKESNLTAISSSHSSSKIEKSGAQKRLSNSDSFKPLKIRKL